MYLKHQTRIFYGNNVSSTIDAFHLWQMHKSAKQLAACVYPMHKFVILFSA